MENYKKTFTRVAYLERLDPAIHRGLDNTLVTPGSHVAGAHICAPRDIPIPFP